DHRTGRQAAALGRFGSDVLRSSSWNKAGTRPRVSRTAQQTPPPPLPEHRQQHGTADGRLRSPVRCPRAHAPLHSPRHGRQTASDFTVADPHSTPPGAAPAPLMQRPPPPSTLRARALLHCSLPVPTPKRRGPRPRAAHPPHPKGSSRATTEARPTRGRKVGQALTRRNPRKNQPFPPPNQRVTRRPHHTLLRTRDPPDETKRPRTPPQARPDFLLLVHTSVPLLPARRLE
ncbi:hypothetical protein BDA96_07G208500, partial [Sorghum bicolor]